MYRLPWQSPPASSASAFSFASATFSGQSIDGPATVHFKGQAALPAKKNFLWVKIARFPDQMKRATEAAPCIG